MVAAMTLFAAVDSHVARIDPTPEGWIARTLFRGGGTCLAVHPHDPRVIYAGTDRGVWKSPDGGDIWHDTHLPESKVTSIAIGAADGAVYAGTEPSRLFRSRDEGRSWTELTALQQIPSKPTWSYPPRPWTHHVRWIAPDPFDAKRLLAGIELGGLMYSDDDGRSFLDHRPGAQRDVHCLAWHPKLRDRACEAAGGGAAFSHDGGRTWQPADEGRDRHYCWAIAIDPEIEDRWYVSASPGPGRAHSEGDAQACIYQWERDRWSRVAAIEQPLKSMPYALLSAGRSLFAGLRDGQILMRSDGADEWRSIPLRGDPLPTILALGAT